MYIILAKLFWAIKFENKIKLKNDELENNEEGNPEAGKKIDSEASLMNQNKLSISSSNDYLTPEGMKKIEYGVLKKSDDAYNEIMIDYSKYYDYYRNSFRAADFIRSSRRQTLPKKKKKIRCTECTCTTCRDWSVFAHTCPLKIQTATRRAHSQVAASSNLKNIKRTRGSWHRWPTRERVKHRNESVDDPKTHFHFNSAAVSIYAFINSFNDFL